MTAFSPGPWKWEQDDHGYDQLRDVRGSLVIESRGEFEIRGPDSRLIAAAPELLFVLTEAVEADVLSAVGLQAKAEALLALIKGGS